MNDRIYLIHNRALLLKYICVSKNHRDGNFEYIVDYLYVVLHELL